MGLPFMGMPSGDTPDKAQRYYHYLQGHQETMQRAATWHVRWLDLAWLWGFLIALALALLLWVWQYRSTRQRSWLGRRRSSSSRSPSCSSAGPSP